MNSKHVKKVNLKNIPKSQIKNISLIPGKTGLENMKSKAQKYAS